MKRTFTAEQKIILMLSALGQFSMITVNLGLVFYLRQRFALEPQFIALLVSLCPTTYFIGLLLFRGVVATLKPVITITAAIAGMGVSGLLILIARAPLPVYLLYALYGLFMALFWPPIMGWLSRGKEGRTLSSAVAWFNLAWSSGLILGPYAAGVLTEYDTGAALIAASALMGLMLLIMLAAVVHPGIRSTASSRRHRERVKEIDRSTYLRYICWIGVFASYFVFGVTMNVFPIHANEVLGYQEGSVGMFLLLRALVTTLCFLLLGRVKFWQFRFGAVMLFQSLLITALILGLFADTLPLLLLFFILFGTAFAGIYTNSIFHGSAGSVNREARMAIHEAFLTAGNVIGSLSGGYLLQHYGYRSVIQFSAAVIAAICIVQYILYLIWPTHRRSPAVET